MSRTTTTEQDTVDNRWEELPEEVREKFESRDRDDLETLRTVQQDINQTLERHLQALPAISNKALQIIRLNGIILTILLAVSSQVENIEIYLNLLTGIGLVSLGLSTIVALVGYRSVEATIGLGANDIEFILRTKMKEEEYLKRSISDTARWVEQAERKNAKMSRIVKCSLRIFVFGLLLTVIGTAGAIAGPQIL